jgi:hypothetical protein
MSGRIEDNITRAHGLSGAPLEDSTGGPGAASREPFRERPAAGLARLLGVARTLGVRATLLRIRRYMWSTTRSLGLRCDLGALPERRPAKVDMRMLPAASAEEAGLLEELVTVESAAEGGTSAEVASRIAMCHDGVDGLHVARTADGEPAYVQWLIGPSEFPAIDRHSHGLYPAPEDGQVLLEGAYTYMAFRRSGAMADGMHQLLEIARERGERSAYTYVAAEYAPAIRGCANVGFVLDHVSIRKRRLFVRRVKIVPADDAAREAWERANAPR